mgnify:CR=1 FL=1
MPAKTVLQQLLDTSYQFVLDQKGNWNHVEWESLLNQLASMGVEATDETKRSLGNILEACKNLYNAGYANGEAKAAAKPKAKAKAKAKPKA